MNGLTKWEKKRNIAIIKDDSSGYYMFKYKNDIYSTNCRSLVNARDYINRLIKEWRILGIL